MLFICNRIAITKKFSHFFSRFNCEVKLAKKSSVNMEKAYFRYIEGDEQFHLSFLFNDEEKKINRQFNLSRKKEETVGELINRISANMSKVVNRKNKKKKSDNDKEAEGVEIKLMQNGKEIPNEEICLDVLKPDFITNLHIFNRKFEIAINYPWISNMSLPSTILAGFPLYPIKFDVIFTDKNKSKYHWYSALCKNSNPEKSAWEKVGDGFLFYPPLSDIGKYIKLMCIPENDNKSGAEMEVISSKMVEAGPGFCPFENRHLFTQKRLSGDFIRVVTYNILADLYCDSDYTRTELFPYCPPYALQIDYRKQLFLKEILGYNGDIVCLQEVDAKIFNSDLSPLLNFNSYDGIFTRKGKDSAEGLACFYRNDRFRCLDSKSCLLGELLRTSLFSNVWESVKENEAFLKRFEARTTTLQAVVLQSLEMPNELIVVGNTHLYFHPDSDHVRLMQGSVVIIWLQNYVKELKEENPNKKISLILCGDFNTVPSCGIYKLYTTGHVPDDFIDWSSNKNEAVKNVTFTQPKQMISACGTPKYTNFTAEFADCLDYIFCDKDEFSVTQVIPLPTNDELTLHTALPSVIFPSDHVALVADLQFKS